MRRKLYTKEFLISELQRFELENGKTPKQLDMQSKFGYPSFMSYINYFGSWNEALVKAGLNINKIHAQLDGTETCDSCSRLKPKNQSWHYRNEQRLCRRCYDNRDYMNEKLDPNSNIGFGFIGQRVVAKVLNLELKYDCNCSEGFGSEYDLYDKNNYGSINVKAGTLNEHNYWQFNLKCKQIPDTYIILGFSLYKSDILRVWITDSLDDLTYEKQKISIVNTYRGLLKVEPWEVDCELYNDAYHSMSLDNCRVLKSD